MAQMQTARHVELITPLGEDALLFRRMSGSEELGRMFQFELELLSRKPDIKFGDLLGQNVTIRLDLPDRKKRYFNGFVTRFNQSDVNTEEDHTPYSAIVSPWLWFFNPYGRLPYLPGQDGSGYHKGSLQGPRVYGL